MFGTRIDISAKVWQLCSSVTFSLQSKQLQPDYVSSYLSPKCSHSKILLRILKCKSVFTARFAQDAKKDYFYGIVTTDPVKMLARSGTAIASVHTTNLYL